MAWVSHHLARLGLAAAAALHPTQERLWDIQAAVLVVRTFRGVRFPHLLLEEEPAFPLQAPVCFLEGVGALEEEVFRL